MLIFHEGLPGSGKSFAAMKDHIIPALKKGRAVYAYIEGLDHDKIAQVAEIPPDECRGLLHQITREQVPEIYNHVENDSLVVIDELQNFWPSGRQKLPDEITRFVSEHRHQGLDVICMGQSLSDCHSLWKRRIDTKIVFNKRDAIGQKNSYNWKVFKAVSPEKFQETTKGKGDYDPAYFGTYASHTEGTENTDTYTDARAVIWNNPFFKKWLPVFGVAFLAAVIYIYQIFSGGVDLVGEKKLQQPKPGPAAPVQQQPQPQQPQVVQAAVQPQPQGSGLLPLDYVGKLARDARPRLAYWVKNGVQVKVRVEFRDPGGRVLDSFSDADLRLMGWQVVMNPLGTFGILTNGSQSFPLSSWPLDDRNSRIPEQRIEAMKPADAA